MKMKMRTESKAAQARRSKAEAADMLRRYLQAGSVVYATVRTVSRSGLSRRIDLYTIAGPVGDFHYGKPFLARLSGFAARALGLPCDDNGVRVDGCGMDMRFHLVDLLSRTLFGHPERQADGTLAPQPLRVEGF